MSDIMNLPNFSLEHLVFRALFYLNNFCLGFMSITHISDGPLQTTTAPPTLPPIFAMSHS
jgi:hypothetical protein